MKKKLIVISCILTMFISNVSYAMNPIIAYGIITHLGTMALKGFNLATTTKDVYEMGTYVYNKLTLQEKQDLNNSYKNDISEFEDLSVELVNKIENEKYDYHYFNSPKLLITGNTSNSNPGLNWSIKVQQEFKYGVSFYNNYGSPMMHFYYINSEGKNSSIHSIMNCIGDSTCSIRNKKLYYRFDNYGYMQLGCMNGDTFVNKYTLKDYYIDIASYSCSNCPHDFSYSDIPKIKFEGITQEQKDFITENYPDHSMDIESLPPNYKPDNNGGNSDNNGGNSILENPPTFPSLDSFDFSALDLSSLGNLFSNFRTKFPFSLPFDLVNLISGLNVDPIPPKFEAEIYNFNFVIDFTQFEELAQIVRCFTLLGYVVSLIFITKQFGG